MTLRKLTSLVLFLVITSTAYGEDDKPVNAEFDKLKVLQSAVGTSHCSGTNETKDIQWEYRVSYKWTPSNKMLVGEGEIRKATANEEIADQPWHPRERRFYTWNHHSQSIEQVVAFLDSGKVVVLSMSPSNDGSMVV